MDLKLLQKKAIQKTAKANGILIGTKIAYKPKIVSRISVQNSSGIVINETVNIEIDR